MYEIYIRITIIKIIDIQSRPPEVSNINYNHLAFRLFYIFFFVIHYYYNIFLEC